MRKRFGDCERTFRYAKQLAAVAVRTLRDSARHLAHSLMVCDRSEDVSTRSRRRLEGGAGTGSGLSPNMMGWEEEAAGGASDEATTRHCSTRYHVHVYRYTRMIN